jgi:hypothetical protein
MTTPASTPTLTAALDKEVYNVGDQAQLTLAYTDETTEQVTLSVSSVLTDNDGNVLATTTAEATVLTSEQDTLPVSASDNFSNLYSVVSNNAGQAMLSTTIGQPPAASPVTPPADTSSPAAPIDVPAVPDQDAGTPAS